MTLTALNNLPGHRRNEELRKCCGAEAWVEKMDAAFPFSNKDSLFQKADDVWKGLTESDWREAFGHHPKIGDVASLQKKFASTASLASNEQASVKQASQQTLRSLARGNEDYEEKFGFIFIVCATGKSAEEMLGILQSRLQNNEEDEMRIAAAEQAKITTLRLEKLLA